jgi:hypothetical protein
MQNVNNFPKDEFYLIVTTNTTSYQKSRQQSTNYKKGINKLNPDQYSYLLDQKSEIKNQKIRQPQQ